MSTPTPEVPPTPLPAPVPTDPSPGDPPPMPDPAHQAEAVYVERTDDEWQDADEPNTFPSGDTIRADRRDALVEGRADRPPTPEEEAAAPAGPAPADVAAAYDAAMERGANLRGEGEIIPTQR